MTSRKLLTHGSAAQLVGLSKSSVRRLWVADLFPRPVRIPGIRGMRFHRDAVETWLAALPARTLGPATSSVPPRPTV